jgi:hypothetical protein
MNFYTINDLIKNPESILENLSVDGEAVITKNDKPTAILLDIADGNFEETIEAVRQAKAIIAFNSMRNKAEAEGYMSDEEIEKEIAAARN